MTSYNVYSVRCKTENTNKTWILPETDPVPTTCPTNTAHEIDQQLTSLQNTIDEKVVKVKEEDVPSGEKSTGGYFGTESTELYVPRGSVATIELTWPFPIVALAVEYVSQESYRGDVITLTVGENTPIGVITSNAMTDVQTWEPKNYTKDQIVQFAPNGKFYTCVQDTVNKEIPINENYWQHGYQLSVSDTAVRTAIGFHLNLFNMQNGLFDEVGRVISVDKENKKIYVEREPAYDFMVTMPTVIRQTVKPIYKHKIGHPWEYTIGTNKIGGSYVPKNMKITISYQNNSPDVSKHFLGSIEYIY